MGRYQSMSYSIPRITQHVMPSSERIVAMTAIGNEDLVWMDERITDTLHATLSEVDEATGLLSALNELGLKIVFADAAESSDFFADTNREGGIINFRINQAALLKNGVSDSERKSTLFHEINHVMQNFTTFVALDSKMNYDQAITKGYKPLVNTLVATGVLPDGKVSTVDNFIGWQWKSAKGSYPAHQVPRERDSWLKEKLYTMSPETKKMVLDSMGSTVGFFDGNYKKERDKRLKESSK